MTSIDTSTYQTMCPMNCHPTLCGMKVEVADGTLVNTSGDKENPDSRGFLCVRGRAAEEIIGNNQRLLHPLVRESRTSQSWQRADWNGTLDRIASAIKKAGGAGCSL